MGLTDYAKRAKEQGRVWWSDSWIERQLAEREVRRPTPPSLPYKVDTSRPSLRTNWTREARGRREPRSRREACLMRGAAPHPMRAADARAAAPADASPRRVVLGL